MSTFRRIFWKPIAIDDRRADGMRYGDQMFSRSPWAQDTQVEQDEPDLPTAPEDDAWSDLLLELTIAAAYANIMANTPTENVTSIFSFLAFFALIWWIWASQVAYNVRFRTRDSLHRVFAILQFLVFCAMATFTSNFNVFAGLVDEDNGNPLPPVNFEIGSESFSTIFASKLRQQRLPIINARGIAITMALSRLLLLVQYVVATFHCSRHPSYTAHAYLKGLYIHIGTLLFSSILYFSTIGLVRADSAVRNVFKILFWFLPIIIEVGSYFYIHGMRSPHVSFRHRPLSDRVRTLLVVIVGEGLNQITNVFKYVVGAVGFTMRGVGIMFCSAIIIIGLLIMYRRANWKTWTGDNRTLLWFFSHYPYLAMVILTLQGVKYLLWFGNLYASIMDLLGLANEIGRMYLGGVKSVSVDQFPEAHRAFDALGLPFVDFIEVVNTAIQGGYGLSETATKLAQTLIYVAGVTFNQFDAFPKEGSDLYKEVETFLTAKIVNPQDTFRVLGKMLAARVDFAFWFWGVAGGSLIMLSVLSLIRQWPVDKYDTLCLANRLFFGVVYLLLSASAAHNEQPFFSNVDSANSATSGLRKGKPWVIASSRMVVPSFALVVTVVNIIDFIITSFAGRAAGRQRVAEPDTPSYLPRTGKEIDRVDSLTGDSEKRIGR